MWMRITFLGWSIHFLTVYCLLNLDHEEALFNPNCRILHLLEDIRRRCNCPENGLFSHYWLAYAKRVRVWTVFFQLSVRQLLYNGVFTIVFLPFFFLCIAVIDLSDLRGAVKNLTDHQSSNASEFLNERETFILVRVESKTCIFEFDLENVYISWVIIQ